MQVNRARSPTDYLNRLYNSPEETKLLFDDMLIRITRFMREPDVFKLLEHKVLPQICRRKTPKDVFRAWVPGRTTGKEPYSLGILFLEGAKRTECKAHMQVFATGIDDCALRIAHGGRYT